MNTHMPGSTDIARAIGSAIREERHKQEMDQRTLALVSDVAVRTVHRIEAGEPTVRLDGVLKVASALGLTLSLKPPT